MPSPSIEIAVTGVQNRRILSGLLLSRLAAKNKAKNKTARIQNKGEKKLSRKPPTTAARPVALELLIPRSAKNIQGPSRPTNTAANALSVPRTIAIGCLMDRYGAYSTQKGAFDGYDCCKISITLRMPGTWILSVTVTSTSRQGELRGWSWEPPIHHWRKVEIDQHSRKRPCSRCPQLEVLCLSQHL